MPVGQEDVILLDQPAIDGRIERLILDPGDGEGPVTFRTPRKDRHGLEHLPGLGRQADQPFQDRVLHAAQGVIPAPAQKLGHVEGIAPRDPVNLVRCLTAARREAIDRVGGERLQGDPGRIRGGDAIHRAAQLRAALCLVIAGGHNHQDAACPQAPCGETHEIERGLVRPMQILDQQQRRFAGLLDGSKQVQEDRQPVAFVAPQCIQIDPGIDGNVPQRPERFRDRQVLAGATQRPGPCRPLFEGAQQGGLACARLAGDENAVPGPVVRGLDEAVQLRKRRVAFKDRDIHDAVSLWRAAPDNGPGRQWRKNREYQSAKMGNPPDACPALIA